MDIVITTDKKTKKLDDCGQYFYVRWQGHLFEIITSMVSFFYFLPVLSVPIALISKEVF